MKTTFRMSRASPAVTIFAAALMSGCASQGELQLAASRGAIEQASASAGPTALQGLALAREKMAFAERLSAHHDHEPARWLAEQAEVDAELAHATDLAARAVREASRLQESARDLRGRVAQASVATPVRGSAQ